MKIVDRIILVFNYIFIVCLIISYLSPFVSPENFTFVAFFGLAYPALFAGNMAFVVYWLIRWKKKFVMSLVAILAGWFMLANYWSFNIDTPVGKGKEKIKVMSYNIRLFDLYNRPHNIGTRNKIFELIKDEAPEIMCLQEFYANDLNTFNTLDTLLQIQKAKKYHFECTSTVLERHHFGLATFTTFPIVNRGKVNLSSEYLNACMFIDVKINSDTIRVYNMHLQSVHLSSVRYKDSAFFETEEVFEQEPGNIFKRLGSAFYKRALQADMIAEHIRKCKYPVIVCGDMNDTPSSYTYRTIKTGLTDAFKESGMGFGTTYAGKIPLLRIDYILHSSSLKANDFTIIPEKLSDHYPVCCTVVITGKK